MKQTYKNIEYDWLTNFTGDPFADAGGYALKEFSKQYPDLDILELIMKATDIYVDRWDAKINPFFLNSKITQPAFNKVRKKEETCSYFLSLIEESVPSQYGTCRIIGHHTKLFPAGRDNSVLTGSGTFVNFHHFFQEGVMLSKEVIIRLHFLPLACESLQGNISLIHSNIEMLTDFFATKCCRQNLNAIATNLSEGILKSNSHAPGTALFRYMDDIMDTVRNIEDGQNYSITLYHFTNFGASPEIKIYALPFDVFKFYRFTQKALYKQQWNSFIANYYQNKDYKKAKYQENNGIYLFNDKHNSIEISEANFKFWRNTIYERLVNEKTITPYILRWSHKHEMNLKIIEIYEFNIRKMKKETISKINQMADFILASNDEEGIKKAIKKLNGVRNSFLLRRFILKDIVAKYYNEGNQNAIITIEDYAEYLFPDTNSWQETRDVLLIAIYQKMHEQHMIIEVELPENEETNEDIII